MIPDCGITTDVIAGFCGETEQDHQYTLTLMEEVVFDSAFMFAYSERPGTLASRKYPDDIPYEEKTRRLNEIIALQGRMSLKSNEKEVGKRLKVLVEGPSKKNPDEQQQDVRLPFTRREGRRLLRGGGRFCDFRDAAVPPPGRLETAADCP